MRRLFFVFMILVFLVVPTPPVDAGSLDYAKRIQILIMNERGPTKINFEAMRMARSWTSQHQIAHNPNLRNLPGSWTSVAEVFGYGWSGSPEQVFQEFMKSPAHRSVIMNPKYKCMGVGSSVQGNEAWTSAIFTDVC